MQVSILDQILKSDEEANEKREKKDGQSEITEGEGAPQRKSEFQGIGLRP